MPEGRSASVPDSTASRAARTDVYRRFCALPWRDQYELWQQFGEYLEPEAEVETRASEQLRRRAEAVGCVRRAAAHAGLDDGLSPTVAQYVAAASDLDLPMSHQQVTRAWRTWRLACRAARGEQVPATNEQRAQRRARGGRSKSREEHLVSLREWLANTSDVSRTKKDYNLWARQTNERRTGTPLVGLADGIHEAMVLPWERCLAVARGDIDLEAARAAYLEVLVTRSGPLRLASVGGIALIFGVGRNHAAEIARGDSFPSPVAKLGVAKVWRFDDAFAHRAGRDFPHREPYELQNQVCDSAEVSRLLTMTQGTLMAGLHRQAWSWVPRPTGTVGNHHYWNREELSNWVEERDARRR